MATAQFDQDARTIAIASPLGKNKLLLAGFSGQEELGRLFRFDLDLRSPDSAIKFEDIVGKNVTLRVSRPDGETRYFNGFISRFVQVSTVTQDQTLATYRAEMVPWLWFLTRTADCRIFQNKSIPDIVKQVCADLGFTDIELRLSGNYTPWEYCVQYRETDFNFVCRLMEQEGIYYFFLHENGKHTLVLCDSPGSHKPYDGYAKIKFRPFAAADEHGEEIVGWTIEKQVQPGKYAHTDYNFTTPSTNLMDREDMSQPHDNANLEIYDFPGEYEVRGEGEFYGKIRLQELQAQYERHLGDTTSRGINVGCKFALENHPRDDQNKDYLVTSAHCAARTGAYDGGEEGDSYECGFVAIAAEKQFRPARVTPKPIVQGPQSAVVVGPGGEEIYTDKHARVKVQFHWDREGGKDENSSCWIRVSQPWAGKDWGSMSTPRIGQEVIVSFMEGDPDQPIITGRVYNAEQMPPYGGGMGVVSGMKSKTHKGSGYNEMAMDDTPGKEEVRIHGQYDMNTTVGHDQTTTVGNNRTDKIGVDDSESVGANQTIKVGANQTVKVGGNQSISVGAAQTLTVGAAQTVKVGAGRTITVAAASTTSIGAAELLKVGGSQSIVVGAARITTVGAADMLKVGGKHSVNASGAIVQLAGGAVMIKAPTITLKAGASVIEVGASGVNISGPMISVKGMIKNNG